MVSLAISGGYGEGETPLPIPNRAVKPLSADGTWLARAWESRSPPVYLCEPRPPAGLAAVLRRSATIVLDAVAHVRARPPLRVRTRAIRAGATADHGRCTQLRRAGIAAGRRVSSLLSAPTVTVRPRRKRPLSRWGVRAV